MNRNLLLSLFIAFISCSNEESKIKDTILNYETYHENGLYKIDSVSIISIDSLTPLKINKLKDYQYLEVIKMGSALFETERKNTQNAIELRNLTAETGSKSEVFQNEAKESRDKLLKYSEILKSCVRKSDSLEKILHNGKIDSLTFSSYLVTYRLITTEKDNSQKTTEKNLVISKDYKILQMPVIPEQSSLLQINQN